MWRNAQGGIYALTNSVNEVIRHNTVAYNGVSGQYSGMVFDNNTCSGSDVRNNIFMGNTSYGINPSGATFAQLDYNLYFGNTAGTCSGCAAQPHSVYQDPWFVNETGNDYRLRPNSPAIDKGADLGVDVNGPGPGNYNGAAPDIGALEWP